MFKLTTASGRTTGNHPYLTKKGWRKGIELEVGEEIAVPKEINEHVFYDDDAQNRLLAVSLKELLSQQLSFPLFFTSFRINNYASKDKYDTQDTYDHSPRKWKSFEEITSEPNYENCFANISDSFSNKFYFSFRRFIHPRRVYHSLKYLSSRFVEKAVEKAGLCRRGTRDARVGFGRWFSTYNTYARRSLEQYLGEIRIER